MKKLTIESIKCNRPQGGSGDDEVFLLVQVDGGPPLRYPYEGVMKMNAGDRRTLDQHGDHRPEYHFENAISCTIWEDDGGPFGFMNDADFLGSRAWGPGNDSGTSHVWGVDGSRYELAVSIEDAPPLPEIHNQILDDSFPGAMQAINAFLADFSDTEKGQELLRKKAAPGLAELLWEIVKEEAFTALKNLILSIIPVKAISIGVMGQVEIFIGVDGACGVAMDIKNFPHSGSVFIGGGAVEGVDGGFEGSIVIGLWFEESKKIGGYYEGVELDVTDVVGVSAVAWTEVGKRTKLKGATTKETIKNVLKLAKVVFVGVDIGIDDGLEAEEFYCLAGHLETHPSFQFQTGAYKNEVVLEEIHCKDQTDSTGHDEVHLYWTVDGKEQKYRFPVWNHIEINDDDEDKMNPGVVVKFDDYFDIELHASGHRIETQRYSRSEFDGLGSKVQHTLDGHGGEFTIKAKMMAQT